MLSNDEQRAWDEFTRHYPAEATAPRRGGRATRNRGTRWYQQVPLPVVGALLLCVLLMVQGAVVAGFALAVATGPVWLLWRFWPELLDDAAASAALRAELADDRNRRAEQARRRARPEIRRNETGPASPGSAHPRSRTPHRGKPGGEGAHS